MHVFYHIPKTGGTSIFNITKNWNNHRRASLDFNHVRVSKYPPQVGEIGYAIVRHPYQRFESAFYHLVDSCNDKFYYRHAKISDCEWLLKNSIDMAVFDNNPNEFILALVDKKNPNHVTSNRIFYNFDIFRSQFYWLGDRGYKSLYPIKLIDYTNMKDEFQKIASELGHSSIEWPKDNSRITHQIYDLNDNSKKILDKVYKCDFVHIFRNR